MGMLQLAWHVGVWGEALTGAFSVSGEQGWADRVKVGGRRWVSIQVMSCWRRFPRKAQLDLEGMFYFPQDLWIDGDCKYTTVPIIGVGLPNYTLPRACGVVSCLLLLLLSLLSFPLQVDGLLSRLCLVCLFTLPLPLFSHIVLWRDSNQKKLESPAFLG